MYNEKSIEKIDKRLKEIQATIERSHKSIDKLNNMREAVVNATISMCKEDEDYESEA